MTPLSKVYGDRMEWSDNMSLRQYHIKWDVQGNGSHTIPNSISTKLME